MENGMVVEGKKDAKWRRQVFMFFSLVANLKFGDGTNSAKLT